MSDNPEKLCRNPKCTRKNPVVGNWCTAGKCKKLRAKVVAAEKAAAEQAAAALAGGAAAQQHDDELKCWEVHSVHGKLGVDLKSLGGQQVPPTSDKTIFYIVFGTFAKSEQEYDSNRGQQLLRMVSFKELLTNVGDEDVKKLSSYEKHGIELHRASRKRLIEEIEAEEDAEDEDEVQDRRAGARKWGPWGVHCSVV